jgi:hypothetical protein
MRLWIESAYQDVAGLTDEARSDTVSTFTTEDQFVACIATVPGNEPPAPLLAALAALGANESLEGVTQSLLSELPARLYLPFALLQVRQGSQASLVECDAPPLFMAREGRLVLLPVIEEELRDRLVRRCDFELHDGDHMALVSEGFLQGVGWDRRWGWRDIAVATRRLTETRCNAQNLAGALIREYQRRARHETMSSGSGIQFAVSVLTMFVRPMRTLTLWSGPPASRAVERELLRRLMAEEDVRVICGDTTAEIAARGLGARLVTEGRPEDGWREVPPASRMIAPDGTEKAELVTEGVVTMRVARERLAASRHPDSLAGHDDGASRLARLLLVADRIRVLVGMAVNPAQVAVDGVPLRRMVVEDLVGDLKALGKIVSVEYF